MRGVHMIICTPGRLNDFLQMNNPPVTNLDKCSMLILDEADRMLDMGFEPQIRTIIEKLPKHQTMMFTATWPKAVQNLARTFLDNPTVIRIGKTDQLTVNKDITQTMHQVSYHDKPAKLMEVLDSIDNPSTCSLIVFTNKKRDCDTIARKMNANGWSAESIHGDKDQWERQRALEAFSSGRRRAIVATDVAARGLDIKGVSHVVNYDFPISGVEDWVHRVGRTGRAGASGIAHTFFDPKDDRKSAGELVTVLKEGHQNIPDWLQSMAFRNPGRGGKGKGGKGKGGRGGKGKGARRGSWSSRGSYGGGGRGGGGRGRW